MVIQQIYKVIIKSRRANCNTYIKKRSGFTFFVNFAKHSKIKIICTYSYKVENYFVPRKNFLLIYM